MSSYEHAVVAIVPPTLEETPIPPAPATDLKTFFLGGIFVLLLLVIMRLASEIFVPIVLAFVLKLVLHPVQRKIEKLRVPRKAAAFLVMLIFLGGIGALGITLTAPSSNWSQKIPESISQLQQRLNFIKKPVQDTQKILVQAEDMTKQSEQKVMPVMVQGTRLSDRVFTGTRAFASGFFTSMVVLFFLLAAGDTFLRRFVEILPRFKDKRQAVDISQHVEQDISVYLLTITAMNMLVGVATGLIMWLCKIDDPLLWGTLAFLLNYVPVVGPIICDVVFLAVGLLAITDIWAAVLPAALYFLVHILEGSFITPMLLARRFTLNPVLVILSLIFWYWMWGFVGAILAVPILAITKIICDRVERLRGFGHFLEG